MCCAFPWSESQASKEFVVRAEEQAKKEDVVMGVSTVHIIKKDRKNSLET